LCFTFAFSGGFGIGCIVPDWASAALVIKALARRARPIVLSLTVLSPYGGPLCWRADSRDEA
jgi:hypothetical protein